MSEQRHKVIPWAEAVLTMGRLLDNGDQDTLRVFRSHEQLRRDLEDCRFENARLRDDVRQLAERVAICSELLGKRAEKA